MAPKSAKRRIVVDGSNIATEGRSTPSLAQLDQAIRAFLDEHPGFGPSDVTVVVDATFGHRIDPSERAAFEQALEHGEMVTPPAGAIGRGDGFILRIAEKAGALVLSNDSFQEFHAERPWLFEPGRLMGGKPVPGVGWVFTPRTPVRGPKSRAAATRRSEAENGAVSTGSSRGRSRPATKALKAQKAGKDDHATPDHGRSDRGRADHSKADQAKPEKAAKNARLGKVAQTAKPAKAVDASPPTKVVKVAKPAKAKKATKATKAVKAVVKAVKAAVKPTKVAKSSKPAKAVPVVKVSKAPKTSAATREVASDGAKKRGSKAKATAAPKRAADSKPAKKTAAGKGAERKAAEPKSGAKKAGRGSGPAKAAKSSKGASGKAAGSGRGGSVEDGATAAGSSAQNDPMTFLTFVAEHPIGSTVEGTVVSFTSHGAHIAVGEMMCHVPLRGLGRPAPSRARQVLAKGETRRFVLVSLDAAHRRAELALPGVAR